MNKEEIEKLIDKYEAGTSTLREEQFLFKNAKNSDPALLSWSTFVKHKKKNAPADFNDSLWASIQYSKMKKRRLTIRIMTTSAAVFLFIFISINHLSTNRISNEKKEALLSEAFSMLSVSEQKENKLNIIYEDEMIIIYTDSE